MVEKQWVTTGDTIVGSVVESRSDMAIGVRRPEDLAIPSGYLSEFTICKIDWSSNSTSDTAI